MTKIAILFLFLNLIDKIHSRNCTQSDYVPHYGTCVNGQREMTYEKTGQCGGPDTFGHYTVSCQCLLPEYQPRYGPCVDGWRSFIEFTHTGCIGDNVPPHPLKVQCPCTQEDLVSTFTKCNPKSKTKVAIHYFVKPCDSTARNAVILPPARHLPCDVYCDEGYYLHLLNELPTCVQCPAGSFAFHGETFDSWHTWPSGFHTTCLNPHCQSWELHGDYVDSGDQVTGNLASILRFKIPLEKTNATITIDYRVNSLPSYHLFMIKINSVIQNVPDSSGQHQSYRQVQYNLHQTTCAVNIVLPGGDSLCINRHDFYGNEPQFDTLLSQPNPMRLSLVSPPDGCQQSSFDNFPIGDIAVIYRGNCTFVRKILNAQIAGAIGVIVVTNVTHALGMQGHSGDIAIPSGTITAPEGLLLRSHFDNDIQAQVNITHSFVKEADIEFTYIKAAYAPNPAGTDRVYIRRIVVTGNKQVVLSCKKCPPGTFSSPTSAKCTPCPRMTYSSDFGTQNNCHTCPIHHVSAEGASTCVPSEACTLDDYTVEVGPCGPDSLQTLSYRKSNTLCIGDVTFDESAKTRPCKLCPTGQYSSDDKTRCKSCPDGSALIDGKCEKCPSGTVAIKTLSYDDFTQVSQQWPNGWKTVCPSYELNCEQWTTIMTHDKNLVLRSPVTSNISSTLLSIPVEFSSLGKVTFRYSFRMPNMETPMNLSCRFEVVDVEFGISTIKHQVDLYPSNELNEIGKYTVDGLPLGKHLLHWHFGNSSDVRFLLWSLWIEGESEGSATQCLICPEGHYCPPQSSKPIPCPNTHVTNSTHSESCTPCPPYFIANSNKTKCVPCAVGMVNSDEGDYCIFPGCNFKPPKMPTSIEFDLSRYDTFYDGLNPSIKLGDDIFSQNGGDYEPVGFRYYLNFCGHRKRSNTICALKNDSRPSYMCMAAGQDKPISFGHVLNVEYNKHTRMASLILSEGDLCEENLPASARIDLVCDMNKRQPSLQILSNNTCHPHFALISQLSCPLCTPLSYTMVPGECIKGRRIQQYFVKSQEPCFGGFVQTTHAAPCSPEVAVAVPLAVAMLLGILILVVMLIVGLAVLFKRFQKLNIRYQQLSRQEMNEVEPNPNYADDFPMNTPN